MSKLTTGLDDGPKNSKVAQSASGIPNDSSMPVQATEEEALEIRAKLKGTDKARDAEELAEQLARPKHGTA